MNKLLIYTLLIPLVFPFGVEIAKDVGMNPEIKGATFVAEITDGSDKIKAQPFFTPTDTYYSTQKTRSMSNVGNIERVWDNYKGAGTKIAIIDSGIDHDHPDFIRADGTSAISNDSRYYYLSGSTVYYREYKNAPTCLDHDWDSEYSEWNYHGSNVAGSAAAPAQGVGTVGIAPEAEILVLKMDFYFSSIIYAINYAVDCGADVINMSLGAYATSFLDGYGESQSGDSSTATALTTAINRAYNAGVIVVAAAGNEKTDYPSYPACNEHVIGVGALNKNSSTTKADFSNFNGSHNETGQQNVDMVAPGYVYAPCTGGTSSSVQSHSYCDTQGTSFSSPIVAGAAALWKQAHPNGTPDQFETDLYASCVDIGTTGVDNYFGHGRLDVEKLLPYTAVTGVEISPSSLNLSVGGTQKLNATITPVDATCQDIIWVSDNEDIATVDNDGNVTGVSNGQTTITVLTEDGPEDQITVTVSGTAPAITGLSLSPASKTIVRNEEVTLTATASPTGASNSVTWSSSNTSVATVTNGVVKGIAAGEAIITATSRSNTGIKATSTITVTTPSVTDKTYTFTNKSWTATEGNWTSLKDGNGYSNSGVQVTTGTNGASANSPISFTGISNVEVTYCTNASKGVGAIYGYAVSSNNSSAQSGTLLGSSSVTTAGGTTGRTLTIAPSSPTTGYLQLYVACTTNSIYIMGVKITYNGTPTPVKKVTSINLTPSSATIDVGETQSLTENVLPADAADKTVTWSSSNSNIATVSSVGLVRGIAQGNVTITATANDGSGVTGTANITVNEVIPVTLSSISVTNAAEQTYFGGTYDISDIVVTATYSDNTTANVTSSATIGRPNTKVLGTQTIDVSYSEGGITKTDTYSVYVTNVGASQGGGGVVAGNENISFGENGDSPTSQTGTGTNCTQAVYDSWTSLSMVIDKGSSTNSVGNTSYFLNPLRIYKNQKLTFSPKTGNTITSVVISASESSYTNLTSSTNCSYGENGLTMTITPQTGTSDFAVISSGGQTRITSMVINYSGGTSENYTDLEQVKAWSTFFLEKTHTNCASATIQDSETWNLLKSEYNAMVNGAKDLFFTSTDSVVVEARERYTIIVNKYQTLDNFVTNSENTYLVSGSSNSFNIGSDETNLMIIIIAISTVSLIGLALCAVYRRRKHN